MADVDRQTSIARCGLRDGPASHGKARDGCWRWEREPGIDDDDWDPKPPPFVPAPTPRPRSVSRDGWWTEPRRPARAPAPRAPVWIMPARDPFASIFLQDDD